MSMASMTDPVSEGRRITGRTVLLALLGFFGVIFIANGILMYLAFSTFSGIESRSAYESGLLFEQQVEAANLQAELGWSVGADIVREPSGRVTVTVTARDRYDAPVKGVAFRAEFEHRANRSHDQALMLVEAETGTYRGSVTDVSRGQWTLVIEAEDAEKPVFRSESRIVFP